MCAGGPCGRSANALRGGLGGRRLQRGPAHRHSAASFDSSHFAASGSDIWPLPCPSSAASHASAACLVDCPTSSSRIRGLYRCQQADWLRARAIIECLVRLGLRAGEVAALRLDDIDWRAGTLRVATSKVRRGDMMPLSARIGRAVAAYLRARRPATKSDHVFVRHYMPRGGALAART